LNSPETHVADSFFCSAYYLEHLQRCSVCGSAMEILDEVQLSYLLDTVEQGHKILVLNWDGVFFGGAKMVFIITIIAVWNSSTHSAVDLVCLHCSWVGGQVRGYSSKDQENHEQARSEGTSSSVAPGKHA
jgi:hypothetical protein